MSEVSCRACKPLVESVRSAGHSPEALVAGLPFDVDDLADPSNRICWDDFTRVLERSALCLGGIDQLEEVARRFSRTMAVVSALASSFVSMRSVYHLGAKWYGRSLFTNTLARCENLPDGRVRQTVEILPPHRDSEEFFRALLGALSGAPAVLGLPNAPVEMRREPRRAEYLITLPRALGPWARARRRFSTRRNFREAVAELEAYQQQLESSFRSTAKANAELAEKSRQLEMLNTLGHELVRRVDVAELAECVLKVVESQFLFRGVAFHLMPPGRSELELLRRDGETSGAPSQSHPLERGNRLLGRLDLWESEGVPPLAPELLHELLPWIALALDNALSFQALVRQTHRLQQETRGRRRAEELLFQAQKMEAIGNLAGGLAHDLNNVLTAVISYGELALPKLGRQHPARADLQEINAAAERGASLISQVLAFSRRQVLVPSRVDLNAVISGMANMLRRLIGEKIELVIEPDEDLGLVMVDPGRFEQVILNLVVNSRDAMPDGGRITIETANLAVTDRDAPRDGCVRVCVLDTGVGMEAETRSRIFEPFFTTKPPGKGTGLGLSTVYGTIHQSGGTISVESELGGGTRVIVDLPRVEALAEADEACEPDGDAAGGRETLLFVEDEEPVRRSTRLMLEGWGYRVLEARNGEEALAFCESAVPIDLLVSDVVMPGMSGTELARRVAALRPEVRGVVYVSGYSSDDPAAALPERLGHAFLAKPFRSRALLDAIRRLLDSGDSPKQPPEFTPPD